MSSQPTGTLRAWRNRKVSLFLGRYASSAKHLSMLKACLTKPSELCSMTSSSSQYLTRTLQATVRRLQKSCWSYTKLNRTSRLWTMPYGLFYSSFTLIYAAICVELSQVELSCVKLCRVVLSRVGAYARNRQKPSMLSQSNQHRSIQPPTRAHALTHTQSPTRANAPTHTQPPTRANAPTLRQRCCPCPHLRRDKEL